MYNDDGEEIFITDKEEELQLEKQEQEKANNPIRQEFEKIKENCNDINCLHKILIKALKNEYERPTINEVEYFILIISDYISKHKTLLDEFMKNLPESKAKLIPLSYSEFKIIDKID